MQTANNRLEPRPTQGHGNPARRTQPVRLPPTTADLVNRLLASRCGGKAA